MNQQQTRWGSSSPRHRSPRRCCPGGPKYGTIDDEGEVTDVGGDVYVYSSPDYALDVNTRLRLTPDGVVVLDSQLLPRHADAGHPRHPRPDRPADPLRLQQPPPP